MALSSLICALALGTTQTQTPSNMFKQIVPKPTGKNGYEEYLIAADYFVNSGLKGRLIDVLTPKAGGGVTLTSRVTALDGFRRVIDLFEAGNRKGAADPRVNMDFQVLFPEYTLFKMMAKGAPHYAYIQLARGNGAEAVRASEVALRMSHNVQSGILIANLVGVAMDGILLLDIVKMRQRFSQKDAQQLIQVLDEIVAQPTPLRQSVEVEVNALAASMNSLVSEAQKVGVRKVVEGMMSDEDGEIQPADKAEVDRLSALSVGDFGTYLSEGVSRLKRAMATQFSRLDQEEQFWKVEQVLTGFKLVDNLAPVYDGVFKASARGRTNMRLTALALRCEVHRWETGSYPTKLSDAVPAAKLYDPLSGKEFGYRLTDGLPDIWSEGGLELGRLDLTFKRPASSEGDERSDP